MLLIGLDPGRLDVGGGGGALCLPDLKGCCVMSFSPDVAPLISGEETTETEGSRWDVGGGMVPTSGGDHPVPGILAAKMRKPWKRGFAPPRGARGNAAHLLTFGQTQTFSRVAGAGLLPATRHAPKLRKRSAALVDGRKWKSFEQVSD